MAEENNFIQYPYMNYTGQPYIPNDNSAHVQSVDSRFYHLMYRGFNSGISSNTAMLHQSLNEPDLASPWSQRSTWQMNSPYVSRPRASAAYETARTYQDDEQQYDLTSGRRFMFQIERDAEFSNIQFESQSFIPDTPTNPNFLPSLPSQHPRNYVWPSSGSPNGTDSSRSILSSIESENSSRTHRAASDRSRSRTEMNRRNQAQNPDFPLVFERTLHAEEYVSNINHHQGIRSNTVRLEAPPPSFEHGMEQMLQPSPTREGVPHRGADTSSTSMFPYSDLTANDSTGNGQPRRPNLSVPRISPSPSNTSNVSSDFRRSEVLCCGINGCENYYEGKHRLGNLRRHQHLKHSLAEGKSYECCVCGKSYQRSDARLVHYRKYHPEVIANQPKSRRAGL